MVFIFAKAPSDELASLVRKVDKLVSANEDKQLAAVVNFIGDPTDEYLAKAKEFGETHNIQNVAITVTSDGDRFAVNEDAEITVMNYKDKKVKFNFGSDNAELSEKEVSSIVKAAEEMLEE